MSICLAGTVRMDFFRFSMVHNTVTMASFRSIPVLVIPYEVWNGFMSIIQVQLVHY